MLKSLLIKLRLLSSFIIFVLIIFYFLINIRFFDHDNRIGHLDDDKTRRPRIKSKSKRIFQKSLDDFQTLFNITDFRFIINDSNHCTLSSSSTFNRDQPELFMIIFVHSAVENYQKRRMIRETWANRKQLTIYRSRLVFMIGLPENYSQYPNPDSDPIKIENDRFGDIIQGNFIDSYHNLTYKHIMAFKWIVYHCSNAEFILKIDDDVFVDLNQLFYHLLGKFGDRPSNLLACFLVQQPKVARSYRNKWRVSFKVKILIKLIYFL